MEKLFLLMVILATCCATPKDLSGKVFVFPRETNTDHVKLLTSQSKFEAVTLCLRFITDLSRNYGLFSLATPQISNDLVLFKTNEGQMRAHARDGGTDFLSLSFTTNDWHSLCFTWNSVNGVSQLWLNGKAAPRRFIRAGTINGNPITILGQEQDNYGGGFDGGQSFIGMITKLHMWDSVLPGTEIKRYMEDKYFTPGNVFNWKQLDYTITGNIQVEDESDVM